MTTASFVLEIDRTDPDYRRLVSFAGRLKNLLDKPKVQGPIRTPSGRIVRFCSIWQIDTGTQVPRFITMYPR